MTNEVAEEFYNITSEDFSWIAPEFAQEWSAEARAQGWSGEEVDAFEHKFMFVNESGVESVSDSWFTAIQACASCSNHSCHCVPSICAAAYACALMRSGRRRSGTGQNGRTKDDSLRYQCQQSRCSRQFALCNSG